MGGNPDGSRFSVGRAGAALSGIAVLFVLLIGRVGWLQTLGRQETIQRAERQQHQRAVLFARRGDIFDRNGVVMAGTVQTRAVYADPHYMQEVFLEDHHSLAEMDEAVARLGKLLGKEPYELTQFFSDRFESRFVKIADNVDDATCDQVQRLALPGVGVAASDRRYYPMGSIASQLMGGSQHDGHGLDGLELKFDKLLSGRDGYIRAAKDAQHRPISVAAEDYLLPEHGKHLVLTIDANIQIYAEQELAAACQKFEARHGEVVVMDPHTGEVLALANYPTFNPQNNEAPPELRRNSALVSPYEPGSTLKPFVMGPALNWHMTRLDERWPITGMRYRTPYGRTVSDVHFGGPLVTWDVLVKSSNIGMSMLAERMGNPSLHLALAAWGFGRPTGIELPGEDPGRLNPLRRWNKFSTESVAQGYEIMVTPLQLCRAFCAYANGGRLVQPTLIRGILDAQGKVSRENVGNIHFTPAGPATQVIDPAVAAQLRRVMCDVPIRGTAAPTADNEGGRSDTWTIFGKTGTAHISQGPGGYSDTRFTSSFLCGAPAEDPRLVVAFIIHEPNKSKGHYGGAVSAPGAKHLIERSLAYLQVPPSPPMTPPPPAIQPLLNHFDINAYKPKVRLIAANDVRE